MQELSSAHLPILKNKTKTNYKIQQHHRTYTNYYKANWQEFTQEIEQTLANTEKPQNAHTATKILTNAILAADKHHIPKGKIQHAHKLLPKHIRNMIKQRNTTKKQNHKEPLLAQQNTNKDKEIQNQKQALWKQHITDNWDLKTNTHTLWKTLNGLARKKLHKWLTSLSPFDNKTAITDKLKAKHFKKQFTNHVKHTTRRRYRIIDRFTNRLKTTLIQIIIEQTSLAIKQAKNNDSTGPDNINIKHFKHLGVTALTYLTAIFKLSLSTQSHKHGK